MTINILVLFFSDMKVSCQMYHAGMTPVQRKTAHREFVHDKVEVKHLFNISLFDSLIRT